MISDASKVLKFASIVRGFTWWTLLVLTNVLSFYLLKQIEGSSSNFKIRAKKWTFGPLKLRRASFTKSGRANLAHSSSILARSPLNLPRYSLWIISVSIWQLPPLPPVGNNLMTEELLSVTGSHLRRGYKHLHAHFSLFYGWKRLFVCVCFDSFCNQLKMTISWEASQKLKKTKQTDKSVLVSVQLFTCSKFRIIILSIANFSKIHTRKVSHL